MLSPTRQARRITGLLSLVVVGVASHAFSQTFYEPVRYQYGDRCNVYYYGGSDPRVHAGAAYPAFARDTGFAFASGNVQTHREVCSEPTRVFADELPGRNAATFGVTPADASNQAYAAVPTYFRKRDLLAGASVQADGTVAVPSVAPVMSGGVVKITPTTKGQRVAPFPRPILIIPVPKVSDVPAGPARL